MLELSLYLQQVPCCSIFQQNLTKSIQFYITFFMITQLRQIKRNSLCYDRKSRCKNAPAWRCSSTALQRQTAFRFLQMVKLYTTSPEASETYLLWLPNVLGVFPYQKVMNCFSPWLLHKQSALLAISSFPQTD